MLPLARALAAKLRARDVVLLEGELGAGKSTFARALLHALGVQQPPEGSPTFAIAHEYSAPALGEIVHGDLYRLKGERELEDAGIYAYLWERDALVLLEWASLWPEITENLPAERIWRVELGFGEAARADEGTMPASRSVRIWAPRSREARASSAPQ